MADNNYTIPSEPLTREEEYLDAIVTNTASGGGGKYVVDELTVTQNGTYTASGDVNAYNPVNVNVANSYAAGDEGKVVNNGELVAQTSTTITTNSIVDTTTNNSVTVNVPNTYAAGDEGKVVSSGELVAQTAYPSTVTQNGTVDTTLNNSVTVNVSTPTEKDVNFYDYDGTLLYAYTAQEFLALDAMPPNPSHSGLTAQGWNWSLSDAKAQVTASVKCDIGQTYTTDDGCTRIYITLGDASLGWDGLSLYLGFYLNGTATIDWGDNTTPETVTESSANISTPHTYASAGDYVISIKVNSGTISLRGNANSPYFSNLLTNDGSTYPNKLTCQNTIRKIEIGDNVVRTHFAFNYLRNLKTITISNSVTQIGDGAYLGGAMQGNSNLEFVVLPNSINTIPRGCFGICYKLKKVSIPNSVTTLGADIFNSCSSLSSIVLPNSIITLTTIIKHLTIYTCHRIR